jgi:hypothetical protein
LEKLALPVSKVWKTALALGGAALLLAGCAAPKVIYLGPSDAKPPTAPVEVQRAAAEAARTQGLQVFGLVPCKSKDAAQRWAAVAAQGDANQGFAQARCFLFMETNGSAYLVSTSKPLNDPRFGEPIPRAHLWIKAVDLDGDGSDELVIDTGFQGASWAPDCAFVFHAAKLVLVHLATLCSHSDVWLTGYDRRQRLAVAVEYCVGSDEIGHVNQPRWPDYFGCEGVRVGLVNGKFKDTYQGLRKELQETLARYPRDGELWFYLGRAHELLGDQQAAQTSFAEARKLGYRERSAQAFSGGRFK